MRGIVVAVAVAAVMVSGCGGGPPTTETSSTVAPTTTRSTGSVQQASLDSFWAAVTSTPGITLKSPRQEVEAHALNVCSKIGLPGYTYQQLVADTSSVPEVGKAVVDTARIHLCPHRSFVLPTVPTYSAPTATVPTAPAGPAEVILSDGTYEVGVDIKAGKWKADGGTTNSCYWARLKSGGGSDIIENELGGNEAVTWAKAGELLKVARCGAWRWTAS